MKFRARLRRLSARRRRNARSNIRKAYYAKTIITRNRSLVSSHSADRLLSRLLDVPRERSYDLPVPVPHSVRRRRKPVPVPPGAINRKIDYEQYLRRLRDAYKYALGIPQVDECAKAVKRAQSARRHNAMRIKSLGGTPGPKNKRHKRRKDC